MINWAEAALGILLALVQINVAVGMLYAGLPAARYRNKLKNNMLEELKHQSGAFKDIDISWANYSNCLLSKDFQSSHNYLTVWIEEILKGQDLSQFDDVVVRFLENLTKPDGKGSKADNPSCSYWWFKNDWDRWVVVPMTFAPVTLLIVAPFLPSCLQPPAGLLFLTVSAGLVSVAIHLWLGSKMVKGHTDKFRKEFRKMETSLNEGAVANSLLKDAPVRLS